MELELKVGCTFLSTVSINNIGIERTKLEQAAFPTISLHLYAFLYTQKSSQLLLIFHTNHYRFTSTQYTMKILMQQTHFQTKVDIIHLITQQQQRRKCTSLR